MKIRARFGGLYSGGGYIRNVLTLVAKFCRKFQKPIYFKQNVEKNLLHVIFVKINRFDHVSDDIPVASFAVRFCPCMAKLFLRQEPKFLRLPRILLFLPIFLFLAFIFHGYFHESSVDSWTLQFQEEFN